MSRPAIAESTAPAAEAPVIPDVRAVNVWKTFGARAALRGVNLKVAAGERLALLGPNGSGKSTFLRVLATLLRPAAGRASIAGFDVQTQSAEVRGLIGVVSHQTFLYAGLSALENVEFYAGLYGVPEPRERGHQLLRMVGMERQANALVRELSRGMQQRVALARAIVHDPQVLLLDEPDTGLDQRWSAFLVDLLREASSEGRTVIITTHNLERSLDLADRVAVLNAGKIVFEADRRELDVGSLRDNYARSTGGAR